MDFDKIENVLIEGDLSKLGAEERTLYYKRLCESLGLNPLTQPFQYVRFQGKLTLYAKKDCAEQLRKIYGISLEIKSREVIEDCYIVTAKATDKTGRVDESTGSVAIGGLKGEARANALMKAETKSKRRVTLSICGLGMLDETEVETIPNAQDMADEAFLVGLKKEIDELGEDKRVALQFFAEQKVKRLSDLTLEQAKLLQLKVREEIMDRHHEEQTVRQYEDEQI